MNTQNLDKLRQYLAEMPAGTVDAVDPIEELLGQAWDELEGSDKGGTEAHKLRGRTEKMKWNPPLLTFNIERHGAAALGSTLAEIQSWTINTADGTASVVKKGSRLVRARDPRWDAKAVAKELAQLIIAEQKGEPRLIWNQKGHVRPAVGKIVPGSNKQTKEGRSQRFWAALIEELLPHGWVKVQKHLEKAR